MQTNVSVLIACVGDHDPRFEHQVLRLVATAVDFGRISPRDIVVGWVGHKPVRISALQQLGISTPSIPSHATRPRHCNKLSLIENIVSGPLLSGRTHLLLLDCDIAFAAPIDPNVVHGGQISGRVVGYANPPMDVWKTILDRCGLTSVGATRTAFDEASLTPYENLNGGVLSFPTSALTNLLRRWTHWADWAVEHRDFLGKWSFFTDQIALALAQMECGSIPRHLPLEYNLAWNTPRSLLEGIRSPILLHYHDKTANGRLMEAGHITLDEVITRINEARDIDRMVGRQSIIE